jgi:preprotein translocase subunit SecA
MEEGQEISSPMVTRSIEKAQKKVEAMHFDMRKNVLEYDQVMDEQRKLVYRERQRILEGQGEDLRKAVFLWIERSLWKAIRDYNNEALAQEDRNVPGLCDWTRKKFGFRVLPKDFEGVNEDGTYDLLIKKIDQAYGLREAEITIEEMRRLERYIMLQTIDEKWKDHLRGMDQLRSGIGWRGYAQTDPKLAYKKEGYAQFQEMWENSADEISDLLFRVRPVTQAEEQNLGSMWQPSQYTAPSEFEASFKKQAAQTEREGAAASKEDGPIAPITRDQPKVKRNDPCPCGSGKKYKKCHGKGGA